MLVLLPFLANCHVYVPLEICFNKRRDFVYLNLLKVHQAYINISKINNKVFTTICNLKVDFSVLLWSLDSFTCFISLLLRFMSISISSPNNNSIFTVIRLCEERRTLFDGALRLFLCRGCFEPLPLFRVVPSSSLGTDNASGKSVTCSSQFLKQWFCQPVTRAAAINFKKKRLTVQG